MITPDLLQKLRSRSRLGMVPDFWELRSVWEFEGAHHELREQLFKLQQFRPSGLDFGGHARPFDAALSQRLRK